MPAHAIIPEHSEEGWIAWNKMLESKEDEFRSDQISRSVVSDSLRPHESQHARPPCPSPTPGVQSNLCPLSRWCHPAISSSVIPFSSCPQSVPASESFPMSQLFAWGGQSTGVSALASFFPKNTQDWSPLEWTGWISLQSKRLSRVFSNTTVQKHQFFSTQLSLQSNSHIQEDKEGIYLLGVEDWRAAVMIGTSALLELYVCAQSLSYVCSAGSSVHETFPSKNSGVGCHFLLRGSFQLREWTCKSCTSCIGRHILYHCTT